MNTQDSEVFLRITPLSRSVSFGFRELWRYRELLFFFVWRDIKVRYKQTVIGALWAVFQPLAAMVVFTVFFGKFAKIPSDNIPYPVFVYVGLLLWNFFSFGLSHASDSMVSNAGIIQKIYFPRIIIPLSAALTGIIDFFFASLIFVGFMAYFKFMPSLSGVALMPLLLCITYLASVGAGCFLAALNVKYRDVRFVLPFFIQLFLFLTPVIYPLSMLSKKFRALINLNPMTGVIETARSALLGVKPVDYHLLLIAATMACVLFLCGIAYFKKA